MDRPEKSWHIPYIPRYRGPNPDEALHVVFLQRLSIEERSQILQTLKEVDGDFVSRIDVSAPEPRRLVGIPWIRDYWPSSDVLLEIAQAARLGDSSVHHFRWSYESVIFVDSGWEAGNVIAAHWEHPSGEPSDAGPCLIAARVPFRIANTLLTICDKPQAYTISGLLGQEGFENAKLDLYKDRSKPVSTPRTKHAEPAFTWPSFLPQDLNLNLSEPTIISLRPLDEETIQKLKRSMFPRDANSEVFNMIKVYDWLGPLPSRNDLSHIFWHMHDNTPEGKDRNMTAFFIDTFLVSEPDSDSSAASEVEEEGQTDDNENQGAESESEDDQEEPQIMTCTKINSENTSGIQIVPLRAESFLGTWKGQVIACGGREGIDPKLTEVVDMWRAKEIYSLEKPRRTGHSIPDESIYSLSECLDFDTIEGTPIFYLHRFTLEEERIVRDALSELNDYEDEDFGGNWIFFGYIFPSNSSRSTSDKHTITDLRDLFEGCHRFSPTFDPKSPYRFANYPRNFIVVDEKCLDEDHPKVLLASSLDFHDPNLDDKLGWYYGYVEAKDAHLNWVNLDIANMGPYDMLENPQKLWLSDLRDFADHDFVDENEE